MNTVSHCLLINFQSILQAHFERDHFFPQVIKTIVHGLHIAQKACCYYLCKQPIKHRHEMLSLKKKKKATLRLWSSIFKFVIFKIWVTHHSVEEHECDFLFCSAYISLYCFSDHWWDCKVFCKQKWNWICWTHIVGVHTVFSLKTFLKYFVLKITCHFL